MAALTCFDVREEAEAHIAALLEGALRGEIGSRGEASLWVSGGSTPGPVYERLSTADLPWQRVRVGLVDERWVSQSDPRSNARLVKAKLLRNDAAEPLEFLPMYADGVSIEDDASNADAAYRRAFEAPATALLGMGSDGHTASWFPSVKNVEEVMSPDAGNWVAAVDASEAAGAGNAPLRLTLTGSALNSCAFAILYITGEEKRHVLEDRQAALPIHHAEQLLGDRLKIVWAP